MRADRSRSADFRTPFPRVVTFEAAVAEKE